MVGVVSAKLSAKAALSTTGALPENVNYAVKSSFLLGFLESVPEITAKLKEPNAKDNEAIRFLLLDPDTKFRAGESDRISIATYQKDIAIWQQRRRVPRTSNNERARQFPSRVYRIEEFRISIRGCWVATGNEHFASGKERCCVTLSRSFFEPGDASPSFRHWIEEFGSITTNSTRYKHQAIA